MYLKTKLMILSIIVIGACMLQIVIHKGVYEGFTNLTDITNDDNVLSFNQYDRKYNKTKDCKSNDTVFEIGQYVEFLNDNVDDSIVVYNDRWESGVITKRDGTKYSIEIKNGDTKAGVDSNRIKNHHQNVCNVRGDNDNECSDDCIEPVNIGGNCLPVKVGKNSDDNDILYQVCPMICRNDDVNTIDLACETDNGCRGCGFSVFEVTDNTGTDNMGKKNVSVVVNKLTKIPFSQADYITDPDYNYSVEMAKEKKRTEDGLAAMSGSTETATPGSTETATPGSTETATPGSDTAQDSEKQEPSNVVNALTDKENCWLGPTGHDAFMYCGPAPFSF